MSLTYPTTPKFRAIDFSIKDPTIVSKSHNGKRIVRRVQGHQWFFTLKYPPLQKSEFSPVLGFISKVRGAYNEFTVIPPNLADPQGTQLNDTTVASEASAGSTSVSLSSVDTGATFKAGDIIKFSGHSKVYTVTDDASENGSNGATVNISPSLITTVSAGQTAKHKDVPFTVALVDDIQEFETDVTGLSSYELDVEESL